MAMSAIDELHLEEEHLNSWKYKSKMLVGCYMSLRSERGSTHAISAVSQDPSVFAASGSAAPCILVTKALAVVAKHGEVGQDVAICDFGIPSEFDAQVCVFEGSDQVRVGVAIRCSHRDVFECSRCFVREAEGLGWRRVIYPEPP